METTSVTTSTNSVPSTSDVLFVINDLDPEVSPSNVALKHPLGFLNVQDLHLLATANLIAQTQETIAQQYNISVEQESEKFSVTESKLTEMKVKETGLQSSYVEKPAKRRRICNEQRIKATYADKKETKSEDLEPPATYICSHCNQKFDTVTEMKTHYKLHNTMECCYPGCKRKFTWPAHLKYHQLTHMGKRNFSCSIDDCGRLFYTAQQLEVHMRTHTKMKPYSCSNCDKAFTTAGNLRNHMRCHTGEKPFVCDSPDCDKRFAELSTLKKHKVTHTGQKPFVCEICGKTFTQSSSRKVHMKSHLVETQKKGDNARLTSGDGECKTPCLKEKGNHPAKTMEEAVLGGIEMKGDNLNYDNDKTTGQKVVNERNETDGINDYDSQQVVTEEVMEVHIRNSITDPDTSIKIIVIPVEAGNRTELCSVVEQGTIPVEND